VYGIVKQSNGNIWVYSEPGKGTTFKIYLPHVDEPLEELKERIETKELPRGNETILLVEDDEEVRKLAMRILRGQGYEILGAAEGMEAFLLCEEHEGSIHLLVTDVVMPKISGRELAERIASIRPEIKVLYMSGYTDNAIVHHGVLAEGVNYIQKPFTVESLARKVREVLDK
jgi:DNA-binding NtrC family response regulator